MIKGLADFKMAFEHVLRWELPSAKIECREEDSGLFIYVSHFSLSDEVYWIAVSREMIEACRIGFDSLGTFTAMKAVKELKPKYDRFVREQLAERAERIKDMTIDCVEEQGKDTGWLNEDTWSEIPC